MRFCIQVVLTVVPGRPQILSRYQPTLLQTSPGFQLEQGSVSKQLVPEKRGGFPETGDRGIGSGVGKGMDKRGSLDWATFHPLPLTPGKTLVIPHSKVTSQGDPPNSCPSGQN